MTSKEEFEESLEALHERARSDGFPNSADGAERAIRAYVSQLQAQLVQAHDKNTEYKNIVAGAVTPEECKRRCHQAVEVAVDKTARRIIDIDVFNAWYAENYES